MSAGPTVLILRFSALGDVVLTTSLLRAIRASHPTAHITFVTKSPYGPLIERHPAVNRVVTLGAGEGVASVTDRTGTSFDRVVDLQGSLRTVALRRRVTGRWTRVTKPRATRARAIWTGFGVHPAPLTAIRYHDAARDLIAEESDPTPNLYLTDADHRESVSIRVPGMVALAPGASRLSKRWPSAHWVTLADRIRRAGRIPVAVGLPTDADVLPAVHARPAWHLSLSGTVALLTHCDAVVANDSGLMHASTAVGTPVVGLFGPTDSRLGFRPHSATARILELPLPCRPCTAFGTVDCPAGHHRCLEAITPEAVYRALEQIW